MMSEAILTSLNNAKMSGGLIIASKMLHSTLLNFFTHCVAYAHIFHLIG